MRTNPENKLYNHAGVIAFECWSDHEGHPTYSETIEALERRLEYLKSLTPEQLEDEQIVDWYDKYKDEHPQDIFEHFVIQGPKDPEGSEEPGEPVPYLFWNNAMGWVDFPSATLFKKDELYSINMPIELTAITWVCEGKVVKHDSLESAFCR